MAATRSYWLAEALAAEPPSLQLLRGSSRADVCIVGGGFTGLWTALELTSRAPGMRVRLLEADVCGGGASGANAGYLMNLWPKLPALRALASPEEANALADASVDALEEVRAFALDHGVECRSGPWLWAATNAAQAGAWEQTLEGIRSTGREILKPVSAGDIEAMVGARTTFGGVVDDSCAVVQPAALCRALLKAAVASGVEVSERSPVTKIEQGSPSTVHTGAGSVAADHVVLAINAWAAQLRGLSRKMVMVASDTAVTEPMAESLAATGWRDGTAISDSRRRLNYYRTTAEGRLVFGKGGVGVGYGAAAASRLWGRGVAMSEMQRQLVSFNPALGSPVIAQAWRAPVEYSISSLPFCERVGGHRSTWYITGYSGDGVGPSKLMARIVASRILGESDKLANSPLARVPAGNLPPEPLRWLGSRVLLPALRAAEHREDRGVRVPRPLRRIADLDPTDFVG